MPVSNIAHQTAAGLTGPLVADLFDVGLLADMIAGRYVNVRQHPDSDYRILDYSQAAQYDRVWNPVTLACRGLIVDGDPLAAGTRVVARPFGKFANLGEHESGSAVGVFGAVPWGRPFEVFAKMDGSLAIGYIGADGLPAVSTRGAFTSDQAIAATELLRTRHPNLELPVGSTLLFEFIAPWNRVVVDYGDRTDLVLLAHLDNFTGADLPLPDSWDGPVVDRFDGLVSRERLLAAADEPVPATDGEGFVIRFAPDTPGGPSLRVKVKYADYVRLHHAATDLTRLAVWRHLRDGGTAADLAELVPDEAHDALHTVVDELAAEFDARWQSTIVPARAAYAQIAHLAGNRREFAAALAGLGLPKDVTAAVFTLLADPDLDAPGEKVTRRIWNDIRPEFDRTDRLMTFFHAGGPGDGSASA